MKLWTGCVERCGHGFFAQSWPLDDSILSSRLEINPCLRESINASLIAGSISNYLKEAIIRIC